MARVLPDGLAGRVAELLARHERVILGVAGSPGAGKSTLATQVVEHFSGRGVPAAWVPMDGFHLADIELDRLDRRRFKGAIDTFDAHGYLATIERIAREMGNTVYAPAFDRAIEEPIAGSVPVLPGTRLVVTEGNYLLDESEPWNRVPDVLTEIWFVDVDDGLRRERLIRRHIRFGKTPAEARDWVRAVDEPNARRIHRTRFRAALIVSPDALPSDIESTDYAQGKA
ncbi:putative fructose transport system kinase [Leifsonia aquatica ATCC 14665]|uniref:Putative fructose transport system kinase n=1 Tax=Leifsonia aquatica ATCC 14665 TaxID=1358026 RepID=U2TBN9_LEIAQ|nr:putative fructose transport system kinase [Leifsonia aquatica ATCC 14665]